MKKLPLLLVAFGVACGGYEKEGQSDLKFEMVDLKVESSAGCSDSIACASFEVHYPEFDGLSETVSKNLREGINKALGYENPEAETMTIEEKGRRFVEDFEKYSEEFNDPIGWYFQSTAEPELISDTLISISVSSEFFTGGAHGGFTTYFVNIDPRDGSRVTLAGVLRKGYEQALTDAGEVAFREIRVIPDSVSFDESGFEFPNGKFQMNENYGFRREGIVFFYNNYEVAPYALGPTEILIPYEVLRDWIQ